MANSTPPTTGWLFTKEIIQVIPVLPSVSVNIGPGGTQPPRPPAGRCPMGTHVAPLRTVVRVNAGEIRRIQREAVQEEPLNDSSAGATGGRAGLEERNAATRHGRRLLLRRAYDPPRARRSRRQSPPCRTRSGC